MNRAEPPAPGRPEDEADLVGEAQDLLNEGFHLPLHALRRARRAASPLWEEALRGLEALHEAVPPSAAPVLQPGDHLGGCVILRVIGRGGMGTVYEAREEKTGRRVALKVLHPALVQDATALLRFKRESEVMRRLDHPHVVRVYGAGEEEGFVYYVMEWVPGQSLARRLEARRTLPDATACRRWAERFAALADALVCAHAAGIVHRDVKPSNILVDLDGRLRLTDFGIAHAERFQTLTSTSAVLGTPLYMAPEQLLGGRTVGPRADVYGLGATLYEVVTGSPPFDPERSRAGLLEEVLRRAPLPPRRINRAVPRGLAALITRALEKRPGDRPDALGLVADLRRVAAGEPVRPPAGYRLRRLGRRLVRPGILLPLLGTALAAALLWRALRGPAPPPPSWAALRNEAWVTLFAGRSSPRLRTVARRLVALGPLAPAAADERRILRALLAHKRRDYAEVLRLLARPEALRSRRAARVLRAFAYRGGWRYEEAVAETRRAEAEPLATVLDRIVWILHLARHAGRRREARMRAEALVQDHPDRLSVRVLLADLYKELGDYRAALDACGTLLMMRPDDPEVLLLRAEIRRRAGNLEGAEKDLRTALLREPDVFYTRWALAELLAAQGPAGRKGALAVIEAGLARKPGSAELLNLRGWHRQGNGDLRGALQDYRAALRADPYYVYAQLNLLDLLVRLGWDEEALQTWERMLADPHEPPPNAARLLNDRAIYHWRRGDRAAAERDLRRALTVCFQPTAKRNLALLLLEEQRFAAARRELDALLVRAPGDAEAWGRRGYCRLLVYDLAGAAADLRRALELAGRKAPAWMWEKAAWAAWFQGDGAEALRAARQALRRGPEPEVLLGCAELFLTAGDPAAARSVCARLRGAQTDAARLAWVRVRCAGRSEGWEGAVRLWRTSVLARLAPEASGGRYAFGRALVEGAQHGDPALRAACRRRLAGERPQPERLRALPVPAAPAAAWVAGVLLLEAGEAQAALPHLQAAAAELRHGAARLSLGAALLRTGRVEEGRRILREVAGTRLTRWDLVVTLRRLGVRPDSAVQTALQAKG